MRFEVKHFIVSAALFLLLSHAFPVFGVERGFAAVSQQSESSKKILSADGRYIDNGDGTIKDTKTGLLWTREDSFANMGKCRDWNDSRHYVKKLKTGGHSDWRMPTTKELKTIYEKSKKHDMGYIYKDWRSSNQLGLDPIFADRAAYWYWSSESAGTCCARSFSFSRGSGGPIRKIYCSSGGVRAVRNP